ncbi:5-oxoprolinase subunit PxpB [Pseudomonas tolaasii]|uniref:5-oxoprolinase subunit PxpB n=1 Tax=Pseudomonas tolaasii TaxID=29442 RepID=UPI001C580DDB|nr:5-oxoprolinase subunit PxpB [Pseudomonas tolaasii]MBW1250783.1 5-oxoprolinase subunit PxpB [Pseudomonas tolaasii]
MNSLNNNASPGVLPAVHSAGSSALLVDVADGPFNLEQQRKLWALAAHLDAEPDSLVTEVVVGGNNLLVLFDPLRHHPQQVQEQVLQRWLTLGAGSAPGKDIDIPVLYGGPGALDLKWLADSAGLDIEEWVQRHSRVTYQVACIGSMPGFAYLVGLPAELAQPRRSNPRPSIAKGSVIIGGAQAGVMPCTAPSGWHAVGITDIELFDAWREQPCLLVPGDRVRFVATGIQA